VKTNSLVTDSTAGIGFAIAKALAAEGARVIVNGRSGKRVTEAIVSFAPWIRLRETRGLCVGCLQSRQRRGLTQSRDHTGLAVNGVSLSDYGPQASNGASRDV
jgi:NAD(P)-dependent dehydrogenase (short-subunit alcohol dehydrogenase family)